MSAPGAAHRTPPDLLVLHALRCTGVTTAERLAGIVGDLGSVDVEGELLTLAAQGLVAHHRGELGGAWGLTEAGKAADAERIAAELLDADARDDVDAAYEGFLRLNRPLLDACSAWQLRRTGTAVELNDHADPVYDDTVLERLGRLDAQVQPVCARLSARLQRFSHYGPRLATALERARSGERDQVTDSLDSYHAVWFQLHEDLLVTLGLSREP
ncbi:MAG TPA: hypothetical protein VIK95_08975 [Egibacteraceae bacterium]